MSNDKMSHKTTEKTPWTVGRVLAIIASIVIFAPMVYGISTVLLSTPFNRAFNHPVQCTIVGASKGESRSKSYSGNSYVFVATTDCPEMRYKGDRNGLTRQEVAERIDRLAGQKVTVDVGYWQVPFSDTLIVGIEGLDLSH
ncbi:hypothetical protein [Rothia terrae]|uniref:hypothetical protein n=1 Tax=Rothia terrae TaxID=396015 RepID=UPI002881C4A9|nr:hypothetical protein [Rothia terrae]MDT0190790.1 hypothetical protein [Rothia terrae]